MSTIAEELTRIQNAKASLATSIAAKGVAVPAATKIDGYAALVDQISQGAPTEPPMKALCFYDYDGTRLYSFDEDEVAAMTELPALPDHTDMGLVQEGWNYTLQEIKDEVAINEACDVGCTYATCDGATHVYVDMDDPEYLSPSISLMNALSSSVVASVDWGDETQEEYTSGIPSHTYNDTGSYVIKISLTGNDRRLTNGILYDGDSADSLASRIYRQKIKKVHLCGARHGNYMCHALNLDELIISKTSIPTLATGNSFNNMTCPAMIFPSTITSYSLVNYAMQAGYKVVSIPPISVDSVSGFGLKITPPRFVVPHTINIPYALSAQISPIYIAGMSNANLGGLLGNNYFQKKYKFVKNIASVQGTVFAQNYMLREVEFSGNTSVPTLANVNAFAGCPEGFKIIVPQSLYEEWKAATNWSTFAAYIYYRDGNGDLKQ